jgi:hypothetical protein
LNLAAQETRRSATEMVEQGIRDALTDFVGVAKRFLGLTEQLLVVRLARSFAVLQALASSSLC